jgi:polysaccharide chain length determinant protein (PEP-CTERM system associated)
MDTEYQLKDLRSIVSRRKKGFWTFFIIIFLAGVVTAIALPPIYKSEAIIQVEEQEISEEFVQSTISEFVGERITKISQQVLDRAKLLEIANEQKLYADERLQTSDVEVVNQIKENIILEPIISELQDERGGRKKSVVTIAFNLSFQGEDPVTVQKVTETLSNLFLEEDIKRREKVIEATANFLEEELARLKQEINTHEKKISNFKAAHQSELPDDSRYNFQAILRLERELDQAESRLRFLREKEMLLKTQLEKVEPLSPIIVEGENVATNPNQRLKQLYLELTKLRSLYSEKHPDIRKVKNEINELETQVKTSDVSIEKVKRLQQLAIKREIAILKPEVNNLMTETVKNKISQEKPDNPAYINLVTQLNALQMEMQATETDKSHISGEIDNLQRRIEKTPFVEKELNALMRDLESAQTKYLDISNKTMEAQVSKELEGKEQSQRVVIASPAYYPAAPFKPNRLLIILASFVSAFMIGGLFVALREGIDDTVKTTDTIKSITGVPVLASVSYIVTSEEKRTRRHKKFIWSLALFLVLGIALVIVNQFIIDFDNLVLKLDQIWTIILERIKMIA